MVRLHLCLLGGETDSSLALGDVFLQRYSPHHYIFHSKPLFPFNFNWLHIKTHHAADQLSQAVCSAEKSARKFSLAADCTANPSGLLNKWDEWYLDRAAGSVMPQTYRFIHSVTYSLEAQIWSAVKACHTCFLF